MELQDAVAETMKRRMSQNLPSKLNIRSLISLASLSAHYGLCSERLVEVLQDRLKKFLSDDDNVDHLTYRDLRKLLLLLEHDIVPAGSRPEMDERCHELVRFTSL